MQRDSRGKQTEQAVVKVNTVGRSVVILPPHPPTPAQEHVFLSVALEPHDPRSHSTARDLDHIG